MSSCLERHDLQRGMTWHPQPPPINTLPDWHTSTSFANTLTETGSTTTLSDLGVHRDRTYAAAAYRAMRRLEGNIDDPTEGTTFVSAREMSFFDERDAAQQAVRPILSSV